MRAAFGSQPGPELALASLPCVFRQMRTERVGARRCVYVYIRMSGHEERSQLSFNAANSGFMSLLQGYSLSQETTWKSRVVQHLYGHANTNTDMCAQSVDDRHLPSTTPPQCIVFLFKSSLSK